MQAEPMCWVGLCGQGWGCEVWVGPHVQGVGLYGMWPASVQDGPAGSGQCSAHLPEHQLSVHVHGQVPKVQEHLVCGQLLLNDVIPIDGHDGHTDEQVEVVRLWGDRELRGTLPSLNGSSAMTVAEAIWAWCYAPGKPAPLVHPPIPYLKTGPAVPATHWAVVIY